MRLVLLVVSTFLCLPAIARAETAAVLSIDNGRVDVRVVHGHEASTCLGLDPRHPCLLRGLAPGLATVAVDGFGIPMPLVLGPSGTSIRLTDERTNVWWGAFWAVVGVGVMASAWLVPVHSGGTYIYLPDFGAILQQGVLVVLGTAGFCAGLVQWLRAVLHPFAIEGTPVPIDAFVAPAPSSRRDAGDFDTRIGRS